MNCLLLLVASVVPAVPFSEVPDPAARRVEALFVGAIRSAGEDEKCRLARAGLHHFYGTRQNMSSPDRQRVAFLAGLLLQTCDSDTVRVQVSWLFQQDLHDADGLPAVGALLDYYEDAKSWDAALLKMRLLGSPAQTFRGQMDVVWSRRAGVRPAVHIPGKRRP